MNNLIAAERFHDEEYSSIYELFDVFNIKPMFFLSFIKEPISIKNKFWHDHSIGFCGLK